MSVTLSPEPQLVQQHRNPPRRCFPGWTMLAIAAAGQYMSAPGQSYSVAALKDPMRESLRISETDFSLAYAFATLISAILVPVFGRLVDRYGARIMLPLIAAGLGAGCFQMSRTESLAGLYFGFSFVRTLGQGALFLVSIWLVGEWFERKRGIATAIAGLGGGLSVMTVPVFNNLLIESYGWQTTWVVLAAAVSATLVVPGFLFIRDRPEDLGLHPDGLSPEVAPVSDDPLDPAAGASQPIKPAITPLEDSWTVHAAIRDPTFWKLLSVPATSGLVGTGLIFHQVALFAQHGLKPREALGLLSVQAVIAMVMSFPAGYATDRIPSRFLLVGAMTMLVAATLLVITLPFTWMSLVYALVLGMHGSIMRSTATVVWINYYGRAHQGAVRGVAWAIMILASAIGPLPLAFSIDQLGSYAPALYGFLVLPVVAGIAVWTATPPCRKD
ncbi:MAG: MFS transporter [Fuerstiella sp.]